MAPQTRHNAQPVMYKLQFREKLVAKSQNTDALLKKLTNLHKELAGMEQDTSDASSLGTVKRDLVSSSIILHKDRGVKAYAACCLADILRLTAPDAPYTQPELRDIFQFFFKQLTNGLKSSDCDYYSQYFHLLESLSTVKSVVLVCDLPNADELMTEIFRNCFTLSRRDLPRKIELFLSDILAALIDESTSLPNDVLDSIMSQFMDKNARLDQPAYRLAVEVCNQSADKLQRNIAVYFTDIIVSHSEDDDFDQIITAHDLIKRMHSSCPDLLHSVIPQLEEEFRAEEVQIRLIVTQTMGEMFATKGGPDLMKKYPTAWTSWLTRSNDKSLQVRLKFVEVCSKILSGAIEVRDRVQTALKQKLLDPDEKVRAAVCKVYSKIDYETALHHVSEEQLRVIVGRGADRKASVRQEAFNTIGRCYDLAYAEIENRDPAAIQHFSWIPGETLHLLSTVGESRIAAKQAVYEHLLPLPSPNGEVDNDAWTARLLNTMRYLDDNAIKALLSLSNLPSLNNRPHLGDRFIEVCIKYNGGVIDEDEDHVTSQLQATARRLAMDYPDPQKAEDDFRSFAKLNETRLYKLLKNCLDAQVEVKVLAKNTSDFTRRLEQASHGIIATMTAFIQRFSLRIINQSTIPTLLSKTAKGKSGQLTNASVAANTSADLLEYISKNCPILYKFHVPLLSKILQDETTPVRLGDIATRALANLARTDNSLASLDRVAELTRVQVLEDNYSRAKSAARFLAFSQNKDTICTEVMEILSQQLDAATLPGLTAHVAALTQFARFAPDAFEAKSDIVTRFLLNQLLLVPALPVDEDGDEEWCEDADLSDNLRAKIFALKIFRFRSIVHASDNTLTVVRPVIKLLTTLIDNNGSSISEDINQDPKVMSRIRLQAAVSLLHLSTVPSYAQLIIPHFIRLALVVQDSCYNVREIFLSKLIRLLGPKLHSRFFIIPFLTAHDPEVDVKTMAKSFVHSACRRMSPDQKTQNLEIIFIRLLHLLAHHPDFSPAHSELMDMSRYINFYLDLILSEKNVLLIYHLALKGKTVRDQESDVFSQNLYVICELAQELIKLRVQHLGWTLSTFPGRVKLPGDIFKALPNPEASHEISKKIYLPAETSEWLLEQYKAKREKKPTTSKRKAVETAGHSNRQAKKRRTRKKKKDDDDDDDEESAGEESDDSDVDMEDRASSPNDDPQEGDETLDGDGEERLGRGARGKAKARAKRMARGKKGEPSSEG